MDQLPPILPPEIPGLRSLQTFIVVAECRNYSLAADLLGLSKGSVSLHIKSLEDQLGTRLFHRARKGRPMERTEAGEQYLIKIRKMFSDLVPSYISDQEPIIERLPLEQAHPRIADFHRRLAADDYCFHPGTRSHALLALANNYRLHQGRWVFDFFGRRSSYANHFGLKLSKEVIGRYADRAQPTNSYNVYDYDIMKSFHLAYETGEPVLDLVECYIANKNGEYRVEHYQRLVLRAQDPKGPLITVMVDGIKFPAQRPPSHTRIIHHNMAEMEEVDRSGLFARALAAWRKSPILSREGLDAFMDYGMVLRPLMPTESLVMAHIGARHASVSIFGDPWRRAKIGAVFVPGGIGSDYNRVTFGPFKEVLEFGEPKLYQVETRRRDLEGRDQIFQYAALLLRVYFEDGAPALLQVALDYAGPEQRMGAA
ncbi:helix-turn-helix domain-containing protein [Aestuariispira insulae]|uniref:Regulatory helix-turn-helix LysR family protein n=1 Tax=Aestuariispira insulae TaxID=1461337 RepID=A0A3D9HDZ6_9PROT|nr:LysR family transcriptional regulator [Aestuariispira insulae]RED47698.1 regulatory helix-turn-helix LysR family protein [Aestuariispira insulae]